LDADGNLVGVTIVGAKALLDQNGEIKITLPEVVRVDSETVSPWRRHGMAYSSLARQPWPGQSQPPRPDTPI
jgi:hypothetical protein